MSRNLADLKRECAEHGLTVTPAGKRESKTDFEVALRNFLWTRDHGDEEMLVQIAPMLGRNIKDVDEATADAIWSTFLVQPKINGCRGILHIFAKSPNGSIPQSRMTSRRVSDQTYRLNENTGNVPHLRDYEYGSDWDGTVLDGELVSPVNSIETESITTNGVLQSTVALLNCSPEKSARIQEKFGQLAYRVFDLLFYKGTDVRRESYKVRYQLLQEFFADHLTIESRTGMSLVEIVTGSVEEKQAFYQSIVDEGGEGVMLKDPQARYISTGRPKTMYKVKRHEAVDAFVIGWEAGDEDKGQSHLVATLVFGAYDENGEIHTVAKCANFPIAEKESWTISENGIPTGIWEDVIGRVYEIEGQEWSTRNHRLVHARAISQRHDKAKEDCKINLQEIKDAIAREAAKK